MTEMLALMKNLPIETGIKILPAHYALTRPHASPLDGSPMP